MLMRKKKASPQTLRIRFDFQVPAADIEESRLEALVRGICAQFKVCSATVDIRIVDDAGIIDVHRAFLGQDRTTDVISFDLSDEFEPERIFELAANVQMAGRQAARRGHSNEAELALYITHGLLHNLGFDDADLAQARAMHEMEDSILQRHGYGIVYHRDNRSLKRIKKNPTKQQ
ncbi:MAG: rRNA maturation RNase YbeY [Planctomycetales bacterium]|nr:rRNA maturation RNase YbeY [Planctomycetales bacterium]